MNEGVIAKVLAERRRQDAKWGEQNHAPERWLAILAEEVGEVAKAALDGGGNEYREELVQAAAVCVAAIESFDRARVHEAADPESRDILSRLELWSRQARVAKFHPRERGFFGPATVLVTADEMDLFTRLARRVEALRKALPNYEITGDEVVQEERAAFEALAMLTRAAADGDAPPLSEGER